MNRLALIILVTAVAVALAGCPAPPDPQVVTREVKVAVPVPCKPNLGARPALKTYDEIKAALAAAPNFDEKTKLITEQLLLYIGWVPKLEAGLAGCGGTDHGGG